MPAQPKRRRRTKAEMEKAGRRREAARKHLLKTRHRMTPEQYDTLLAFQGGVCYICRRAKGATRALSVDHDHAWAREHCDHPHEESCIECWRGLLCVRCNQMLAHARDDGGMFYLADCYLRYPPAHEWRLAQDD